MTEYPFTTVGGLKGTRRETPLDHQTALDAVWAAIDTQPGGLLVSNYEVPNRYARWDIGFIHPPLELSAQDRHFTLRALTGEGQRLLPLLGQPLLNHPHLADVYHTETQVSGRIVPPPDFFPEEERSRQPSFFSVLRALLAHLHCDEPELGFYGAFGFDLVFQFETLEKRMSRLPQQRDCVVYLPTELVVVDRQKERAQRIVFDFETPQGSARQGGQQAVSASAAQKGPAAPASLPPAQGPTGFVCDHAPGEFEGKVEQIRQGCRRGDYFEVLLSQTFTTPCADSPTSIFRRICKNNPSPYSFLLNLGAEYLVGASPEMFVRAQGNRVETSPISGTVSLGASPMENHEQIKRLLASEKEESELTMCTDVDRNDMTRVCVPGSVQLIGRRLIETYSRLIHTVDHVEGQLDPRYDSLDAFVTHLWACTVTGSPKPMALRAIEALEKTPRRWYAGAVGYIAVNGALNTGMTIRTVHLENGTASVRAGATLLYDSDPAMEERETRLKAQAFLEATLGQNAAPAAPGVGSRQVQPGLGKTVLFVDFLDSFVHTLASYVRVAGANVITVREGFPERILDEMKPDLVFLSPGPGTPAERGVGRVVEMAVRRGIPLFGVCLGHQGIGEYFGATLAVLDTPVHGKPGEILHQGQGFLAGLASPFKAGRYHSLHVLPHTLPPELEPLAHTADGVLMAMRHRSLPICSVQFHPESILTLHQETGQRLINNLFSTFLG